MVEVSQDENNNNNVVYEDKINFTTTHFAIMTISSTITCLLSICGSCAIIYLARNKLNRPYHVIMTALSISDILFSTSVLFQPYLTPSNQFYSIGTTTTCSIVGFLFHTFAMMGAMWNCILSLYFLLTIRYGWSLNKVTTKFQRPFQIPAILIPIVIGTLGLITRSFNPFANTLACTLESYPPECGNESPDNSSYIECIRGRYASLILNLQAGIVILVSLTGFVGTFLVYWTVRKTIRTSTRHAFPIDSDSGGGGINNRSNHSIRTAATTSNNIAINNNNSSSLRSSSNNNNTNGLTDPMTRRIQAVGVQALLYSLVYVNQMFWPFLSVIIRSVFADQITTTPNFILALSGLIFYPLQGLLNFIVYIRPDVARLRRRQVRSPTTFNATTSSNNTASLWALWKRIIFTSSSSSLPDTTSSSALGHASSSRYLVRKSEETASITFRESNRTLRDHRSVTFSVSESCPAPVPPRSFTSIGEHETMDNNADNDNDNDSCNDEQKQSTNEIEFPCRDGAGANISATNKNNNDDQHDSDVEWNSDDEYSNESSHMGGGSDDDFIEDHISIEDQL